MDTFRKKQIKLRRSAIYMIIAGILIAIIPVIFSLLKLDYYQKLTAHQKGFTAGLSIGIVLAACALFVHRNKLIRSPEHLKVAYIKSIDERNMAIDEKSGKLLALILYTIFLILALLAQYLISTLFYTFFITAMIVMVVHNILRIYYQKKI